MTASPSSNTSLAPESASNLTTSQFYADTAPRYVWRPQLDAWVRKHPAKFKELANCHAKVQKCPYSNYTTLTTRESASVKLTLLTTTTTSSSCSSSSSTSTSSNCSISPCSPINSPMISTNKPISPLMASDSSETSPLLPTNPKFTSEKDDVKLPSPPQSPPQYGLGIHHSSTTTSNSKRKCISCGSGQSPCWRPSWSLSAGQLCNSCGLRYKKTGARCLSSACGRIPAKCEWAAMQESAILDANGECKYLCLACGGEVEVRASSVS